MEVEKFEGREYRRLPEVKMTNAAFVQAGEENITTWDENSGWSFLLDDEINDVPHYQTLAEAVAEYWRVCSFSDEVTCIMAYKELEKDIFLSITIIPTDTVCKIIMAELEDKESEWE